MYSTFNPIDVRNCIRCLGDHVRYLNRAKIHNNDITHLLGLQNVPGNRGRLTHFLLHAQQQTPVYKYSTLLYTNDEHEQRDVEHYVYFARYYLRMICHAIVEYIYEHPGCTQAEISKKCLGLAESDYGDKHWIASQLLSVLRHHNVIHKYRGGEYRKGARTSLTLVSDQVADARNSACVALFESGRENVMNYMTTKRIGTQSQMSYARHLLANASVFGIYRIELQKTFPGLHGVGGCPLRFNIYIEQENGTKRLVEISKSPGRREHAQRKLQFSMDNDNVVLVQMTDFN